MEMTEQHAPAHLPAPISANRWALWGLGAVAGFLAVVARPARHGPDRSTAGCGRRGLRHRSRA
jgi:hypothetical protein